MMIARLLVVKTGTTAVKDITPVDDLEVVVFHLLVQRNILSKY